MTPSFNCQHVSSSDSQGCEAKNFDTDNEKENLEPSGKRRKEFNTHQHSLRDRTKENILLETKSNAQNDISKSLSASTTHIYEDSAATSSEVCPPAEGKRDRTHSAEKGCPLMKSENEFGDCDSVSASLKDFKDQLLLSEANHDNESKLSNSQTVAGGEKKLIDVIDRMFNSFADRLTSDLTTALFSSQQQINVEQQQHSLNCAESTTFSRMQSCKFGTGMLRTASTASLNENLDQRRPAFQTTVSALKLMSRSSSLQSLNGEVQTPVDCDEESHAQTQLNEHLSFEVARLLKRDKFVRLTKVRESSLSRALRVVNDKQQLYCALYGWLCGTYPKTPEQSMALITESITERVQTFEVMTLHKLTQITAANFGRNLHRISRNDFFIKETES
eukprot:GDKJ01029334.1.p1 GENE.GDKJ01029334.1~~GDKJ01029334.1.p1  ORF type:complete len:422 (+),score=94.24 GDKJ01029334.1:99-1268(+)